MRRLCPLALWERAQAHVNSAHGAHRRLRKACFTRRLAAASRLICFRVTTRRESQQWSRIAGENEGVVTTMGAAGLALNCQEAQPRRGLALMPPAPSEDLDTSQMVAACRPVRRSFRSGGRKVGALARWRVWVRAIGRGSPAVASSEPLKIWIAVAHGRIAAHVFNEVGHNGSGGCS